jgi:hypothetical protein
MAILAIKFSIRSFCDMIGAAGESIRSGDWMIIVCHTPSFPVSFLPFQFFKSHPFILDVGQFPNLKFTSWRRSWVWREDSVSSWWVDVLSPPPFQKGTAMRYYSNCILCGERRIAKHFKKIGHCESLKPGNKWSPGSRNGHFPGFQMYKWNSHAHYWYLLHFSSSTNEVR